MTPVEFSIVLGLGLVSGLHCLQMCGPIVLAYSLSTPSRRAPSPLLSSHLAYNAGRILTYTLLGAVAGAAGQQIGLLGKMAGLATAVRIAAGAAMLIAGILMFRLIPTGSLVQIQPVSRFSRAVARLLQAPGAIGKFRLGLLLGFLPCGLIYAALLKSVEAATAAAGALTMLAFGLGTAVSLLTLGVASSFAGLGLARWSNRLAPAAVMIFGAILLYRGLVAPGAPLCHAHF